MISEDKAIYAIKVGGKFVDDIYCEGKVVFTSDPRSARVLKLHRGDAVRIARLLAVIFRETKVRVIRDVGTSESGCVAMYQHFNSVVTGAGITPSRTVKTAPLARVA